MKEVTEWDNNPRMMWVWDDKVDDKEKKKVVYIMGKNSSFPVITVEQNGGVEYFKHCAEIEALKTRRMTNKELSRWLREKPTRECKWTFDGCICSVHTYNEKVENEEVCEDIVVREDDGEWREPLVEIEE